MIADLGRSLTQPRLLNGSHIFLMFKPCTDRDGRQRQLGFEQEVSGKPDSGCQDLIMHRPLQERSEASLQNAPREPRLSRDFIERDVLR